jgi:RES domain-containing protein
LSIAWRIADARFGASLSGEGGLHASGRWHRAGVRIVYLSEVLSLAALEVLVHFRRTDLAVPFQSLRVEIPDRMGIETLAADRIPADWRAEPPSASTQALGLEWLAARRSALLRVPSAVIPQESNYLLNPLHPDAGSVRASPAEPFTFDPRLWR